MTSARAAHRVPREASAWRSRSVCATGAPPSFAGEEEKGKDRGEDARGGGGGGFRGAWGSASSPAVSSRARARAHTVASSPESANDR